ncbi:hypothetical protein [Enterococcus sp. LJL51]|uniref:hypothetical protein n=1 Tax=Enterococcus sp. LJL51 TaxID=3416656 RepID=UPI003CF8111D
MKKISSWLILAALFIVSGCTQEKAKEDLNDVPKDEAGFIWQAKREKNWGEYTYSIPSSELDQDLAERFSVELTPVFHDLQAVIQQEFPKENLAMELNEEQITAKENQLTLVSGTGFREKGTEELAASGILQAVYSYDSEKKLVRLMSQQLELVNWTGEGQYYGKSLEGTVRKIGEILEIKGLDQVMSDFEKKLADKEKLKGQLIELYNDEEETSIISRSIRVTFSKEEGLPEKIYADVIDHRT